MNCLTHPPTHLARYNSATTKSVWINLEFVVVATVDDFAKKDRKTVSVMAAATQNLGSLELPPGSNMQKNLGHG